MVHDIIDVLYVYIFFDTIHGVLGGVARGLGKQMNASLYTLFCYYAIGLPLALVLAFNYNLAVKGLWLGFAIMMALVDLGLVALTYYPDWGQISAKMRSENTPEEDHAPEAQSDFSFIKPIATPEAAAFKRKKNEYDNKPF